jgi:CubicO group peptidase (beta-lactamase class C family)
MLQVKNQTCPGITRVDLTVPTGVPYIWKTAGVQSVLGETPITEDSAFFIFSITKTLTSICALQCVERGEIALDDAVYDILPELKEFDVISIVGDQKFSFAPHTKSMTLRHLLTHTSGIAVDVFDPRLQAWRMNRGEAPKTFCGKSIEAYTLPLVFEPGEGWSYGGGVEWAGILIERLTKMKLGAYMEKYIFEPLGMVSSTFHPDKNPEIMKNLVDTSTRISDGTVVPMFPLYPLGTEDDSGAMGLVSTLKDILKLTTDLLQPVPKILKLESVNELTKPQFPPGSPASFALAYAIVS